MKQAEVTSDISSEPEEGLIKKKRKITRRVFSSESDENEDSIFERPPKLNLKIPPLKGRSNKIFLKTTVHNMYTVL